MRRFSEFFKTFTPASAGGESYVDLAEQKGTYFDLTLEIKKDGILCNAANMDTTVDYVELLINNTVQRKFTSADLRTINASKGRAFVDGYLDIFFAEPDSSTGDGEDSTAWSMDGVASFVVKVYWLPGAWTPSVEGYRTWHPVTVPAAAVTPVTYVHKQFNETAGDRQLDIDNNGREINHIHLLTDKITDLTYYRNDSKIISGNKAIIDHQYKKHGYVPVSTAMLLSQKMLTSRAPDKIPSAVLIDGRAVEAVHQIDVTLSADSQFNTIIETVGRWR